MNPSTFKEVEVTSFFDVNLGEVIELPKFDFTTITIENMRTLGCSCKEEKQRTT